MPSLLRPRSRRCPCAAARTCFDCSSNRWVGTSTSTGSQVRTAKRPASPMRASSGQVSRLSALLNHLYVLIPVLDDAKHYWVGDEEIDKLLKRGEGWLEQHPAKELIVAAIFVIAAYWCALRSNAWRQKPRTRPWNQRRVVHRRMRWKRRSGSTTNAWRQSSRRFVRPARRPLPIWAVAKGSCCIISSASDGPTG